MHVAGWTAAGVAVVAVAAAGVAGGAGGAGSASDVVTPPAPSPPLSASSVTGPRPAQAAGQSASPGSLLLPAAAPQPTAAAMSSPKSTPAVAALATLPVKGRAPKTGYSRARFGPAWTDSVTVAGGHNGCDTRNDILRRDLSRLIIKPGTRGCVVAKGVLRDPYTAASISFVEGRATSGSVQIDHVVALGDAWQTGAQQLSLAVRTNFANDPLNLLAVSGRANDQKGDADAASWLPPNKSFRCHYVAIQVAVKVRYHLWVTKAEHDAIARVLSACPKQVLPTAGGAGAVAVAPAAKKSPPPKRPAPKRPAPKRPAKPPARVVRAGSFCSPAGARGVTTTGLRMVCKLDRTKRHYRWSRA